MKFPIHWFRNQIVVIAAVVLAIPLAVTVMHRLTMTQLSRRAPMRVATQHSPPWVLVRPNGSVEGPIYEIVNEAARRQRLDVTWSSDAAGPDHALDNGNADVWPLMGRLASRLSKFPITSPWLEITYLMSSAVPCAGPEADPPSPRSIAHRGTMVTDSALAGKYPNARQVRVKSHEEALAAVCSGQVDAAVIAEASQSGGYRDAPEDCRQHGVCLRTSPLASVGFGVGSRPHSPEARAAAILIRTEIDRMIDDGTLAGILLRWGVSSGEIRALRSAHLAVNRARIMTGIALVLVCALVSLSVVYRRLLAAKAELQAEFQRRTELEQRYYKAQKLQSLGRLAGGIAHDFNNLLTIMLGFTELAKVEAKASTKVSGLLNQIQRAGERASALTKELLAFSRRQVLSPEVIDLNAVVLDSQTMIAPLLQAGILVKVDLDPGIKPVLADSNQVHQVVMNLAVNARDAMPDGGVLTIQTRAAGKSVLLTVTDTGTGFSPEARQHLYEPFYTTKPAGKGTGLGLSTVYGIVEQSGGEIMLESETGKGTRFTISFPVTEGRPTPVSSAGPAPDPKTATVLIVDDDAAIRRFLVETLAARGHRAIEAPDGENALQKVLAGMEFDLLVTDVMMPGMTGSDLTAAVRVARPEIPILFISGHVELEEAAQLLRGPKTWFLEKPFDGVVLESKIQEILSRAAG